MRWFSLCLGLMFFLSLRTTAVCAHAAWPVYINVNETANGIVRVYWQVPAVMPYYAAPAPVLPKGCMPESPAQLQSGTKAFIFTRYFHCDRLLAGQQLGIQYPQYNPSLTTLYQVKLASGSTLDHVLAPDQITWEVPEIESCWRALGEYLNLGVHHILQGVDHLLFVLCLIIIAETRQRLLVTITGFTVGHSVTLTMATLRIITPPVGPIEAGIALSIVLLAAEIIRNNRTSLTWRKPAVVSVVLGLLHGFGFSSVLRQSGLPPDRIPTALLGFNIGVEIGQLLFVAAVLLLTTFGLQLWRRLRETMSPAWLRPTVAYGVGTIAAFWYVQRLAAFA